MKIKVILIITFLSVFGQLAAQIPIQEKYWVLTDSILLEFNNTGLPTVSTSSFRGSVPFPNAAYADASGFFCYSSGALHWNSNHEFMQGSWSPSIPYGIIASSIGWSVLVESELDSNLIFSLGTRVNFHSQWQSCYTIDKTLDNGLGAEIDSFYFVDFAGSLTDSIDSFAVNPTLVKDGDGQGWWILMHYSEDRYTLSDTNNIWMIVKFEGDTFSTASLQHVGFEYICRRTHWHEMCFSLDGTKFATATITGILEVYDFDRCTGLLSNAMVLSTRQNELDSISFISQERGEYFGCAFSPSGQYLYANSRDTLWQFDLEADNIPASSTVLWYDTVGIDSLNLGRMELGPDGRIYIGACDAIFMPINIPSASTTFNPSNQYNSWLGVVFNPDSVGAGCEFKRHGLYLGGRGTNGILPRTYNTQLGVWVGSPCDPNTTGETPSKDQIVKFKVFPNPAKDKINITWPVQGGYSWALKTIAGVTLSSGVQQTGNTTISTAMLPEGMYFLEVQSAKEMKVEKVIILSEK